jgi:hypothetical protein
MPHCISFTDEYGDFKKDFFFGHMKIYLKSNKENESLPKSWKISRDKVTLKKLST